MANEPSDKQILNRTLPYNLQAEQMLLGAILINPDLLNQVVEFLKTEHFFEILHQKIYRAIIAITDKSLTPTQLAIRTILDREEDFQASGGSEYLTKLATLAIMVINPYDYGRLIYDLAIKRNLIKIGEDIVNTAYDQAITNEASTQIEQAENNLYHLATEGFNERSFVKIANSVSDSLASINRAMKNASHVTGITTGLLDLDMKLSGFHNSDLVIIAGRPSMGKTAFAINLAINACKAMNSQANDSEPKAAVGFFSLEMSSEQLANRLLSSYTAIDSASLRSGFIKEEQYNDIRKAAIALSELPFFIDDTPALTISAIRTRARRLKRKHNLAILFIDYLQLIRGSAKIENRVLEVSEITQGLKAIAKELNIPVIALSQLSRAVEQREDKKPMLSDLRESGSIEQDADIVMFLYREEYYLTRQEPTPGSEKYIDWQSKLEQIKNVTEVIVAKHRNGPIGNVRIYYDSHYSKFSNLDKLHRS